MTTTAKMTRRAMLGATAALPIGAALPAWAKAPMLGASQPLHRRFVLGDFEVTMLLAGSVARDNPQGMFGINASEEDFAVASAEANIPNDKAQFFFTPVVVNTGNELVLFDTGLNPEGITAALDAAGYSNDQVDKVVITHMHGDHIGGLMGEGGATFENATYATASREFDHWSKAKNDGFDAKVFPLAEKMDMIEDGANMFSGHTAMAAYGHTPGHMAHMIESGGKQLVIAADFANHYVWSLARPDWHFSFDIDKEEAAKTRRRLLDMFASDKLAFAGYHMPWPGVGYVEAKDGAYRYVPSSYQLLL
jgi:glyoxylase-like metal-dependent hydrolase (beta-lactamase superfamily II)